MFKIINLFCWVLAASCAYSQEVKPLQIGDQVPDLYFHHVLNYKKPTVRLSDFKGKLVILDMWSVHCTTCIKAFPEMEKLQKRFNDKIQILLVNSHDAKHNSEKDIKNTMLRFKARTGFYPSLPIPIHDSILNSYFPHEGVPHQVWIDGTGKLIAFASGFSEDLGLNIENVLAGKKVDFNMKDDYEFNRTRPLFLDGNGPENYEIIYRSIFTKNIGGAGNKSIRRNERKEIVGACWRNFNLMRLVKLAYLDLMNGMERSRIIKEVSDTDKFSWEEKPSNMYCYDLIIPPTAETFFNPAPYLQQDLKRVFNISARKEKRKQKCLIITVAEMASITKHFSSYTKSDADFEHTTIKKYFHGMTASEIVSILKTHNLQFIDETYLQQRLDLDFPDNFDLANQEAVIDFLKTVGFAIKEEERELEVVVITDKN